MSFPINDSSVYVLNFVEANVSFMSFSRLIVSIQVGIPSEGECLCTNLGMSFDWLVVPPPPVSLRRVDRLASGFLVDVVLGIVYR